MHVERCICEVLTPMDTPTKLALVMHRREVKKSTNTGHLALKCLSDSELFVRGHQEAPADLAPLEEEGRTTLLLFPREDAEVLNPDFVAGLSRPLTLIVPDGTWAQARRMVKREPVMTNAIAVLPPPGPKTEYRLRHEHVDGGLATGEAIARALGALDGPAVQAHSENAFRLVVEGTLASRGRS